MANGFTGAAKPLDDGDIEAAAAALGCERAVIDAVCEVESAGGGFLPDDRPKILFEAHVFGRLTGGRWTRSHPNVSAPEWNRALYGAGGAHQYERLEEAIALDRDSALQSASWGRFQMLGTNYPMTGSANVEAFVTDMCDSEAKHLGAFLAYCRKRGLAGALRARDWATFARGYNGSGQVEHYAAALAAAYARRSARPSPGGQPVLHLLARGPAVRELQQALAAAGLAVHPDGIFGQETLAAVRQFQMDHELDADGVVGADTWAALA